MAACSHCGDTIPRGTGAKWDIRLCADGRRKRSFRLCDPCDTALNRHMLIVMGDKDVNGKMKRYEERQ
jgi:hypothetical protein